MVILLLTNKWDISVDYIVEILRKRNIQYIRLNTEDFIQKKSTVSFPQFSFYISNKLDISNLTDKLRSVLFRRPGKPFEFSTEKERPPDEILNFIVEQWYAFVSGLRSISNVTWINDPSKNSNAEIKIKQLAFAEKTGLKIPKTCITSDKYALDSFWKLCDGKVVAKPLYSPLIKNDSAEFFIFSNKLQSVDDISEEELSISPTIFQEELENKTDYRITIIGQDCFPVEIKSNNGKAVPLDWRTAKDNIHFKKCDIPTDIMEKCIGLVSELGLIFGAIDMVKVKDEFYFLEINPNGEWGWLQKQASLPIAESIVDHLTNLNDGK